MRTLLHLVLVLVAVAGGGCGGIRASKSFSPLDFILPGLMEHRPPSQVLPCHSNTPALLATASSPPPPRSGSDANALFFARDTGVKEPPWLPAVAPVNSNPNCW